MTLSKYFYFKASYLIHHDLSNNRIAQRQLATSVVQMETKRVLFSVTTLIFTSKKQTEQFKVAFPLSLLVKINFVAKISHYKLHAHTYLIDITKKYPLLPAGK